MLSNRSIRRANQSRLGYFRTIGKYGVALIVVFLNIVVPMESAHKAALVDKFPSIAPYFYRKTAQCGPARSHEQLDDLRQSVYCDEKLLLAG